MSSIEPRYQGFFQDFSFRVENGSLLASVDEHDQSKSESHLRVVLPPAAPNTQQLPILERIDRMLQKGWYPYVKGDRVFFAGKLVGGMIEPEADDVYIPRDWSKPVRETLTIKEHTQPVLTLIELRDGTLASGSSDGTIKLWNKDTGKCLRTLTGHTEVNRTLIELRDGTLANGSLDKTIKIWDKDTGKCLRTLTGHTSSVQILIELRNGNLASGSKDKTIKIWDKDTGKCIHTLTTSRVWTLIELRNGNLASGSEDKTIKIWDKDTGKCIRTLTGHTSPVDTLIELKDGTLASGSEDNTIKIWDKDSGKCLRTLTGHTNDVEHLIELKDGTLASGSKDKTIKLWDKDSGKCIHTLTTSHVLTLIELRNGNLASGSEDGTIKIWDKDTGKCIHTLTGHTYYVWTLIELRDGTLASGSLDQTIKIWEGEPFPNTRDIAQREILSSYSKNDSFSKQAVSDGSLSQEELIQKEVQRQLAQYREEFKKQGKATFEQLFKDQAHIFHQALEASQNQLRTTIKKEHTELFATALRKNLEELHTTLTSATEGELQKLQGLMDQRVGSKLQEEMKSLLVSTQYQAQMQQMQQTIVDEIGRRQRRLIKEMFLAQQEQQLLKQEQSELKENQSRIYALHQPKLDRLKEQQELQNPDQVRAFYNTTEKYLSSKLMSAMMLVSDMLVRKDLKIEKGAKFGTALAGSLCGFIPYVGNVVGTIVNFAADEVIGAIGDKVQGKKYEMTFDTMLNFEDAMALGELAARRTTKTYLKKITSLTEEKAAEAGERAANFMYEFIQSGKLKAYAHKTMHEKVEALVAAVQIEAATEHKTGLLKKKKQGGIFDQPESPAARNQVQKVTQNVQGLKETVELMQKSKGSSRITSIIEEQEKKDAVLLLRSKRSFPGKSFEITRVDSEIKVSFSGPEHEKVLKQIAMALTTFDPCIVPTSKIEAENIIIIARMEAFADDLEAVLRDWLNF